MTTLSLSIPRPVHPTGVWGWITTIDHKRIGIPLRRHGLRPVRDGRHRGAHHAHAAGQGRARPREPGDLQPAVYDARDDDDLPGHHADGGRLLQLHHPVADRRAGRRLPAPERLQLLDLPRRGDHAQRKLVPRRRAERRLVRLRPHNRRGLQPGPRHRLLDHEPPDTGHRLAGGCLQLHRHDNQHEGPRHDPDAHAAVHLDDAYNSLPPGVGLPGHKRSP